MAMKVSAHDGVKVYNVSSGKSVPEWLSEGKKKSLKTNEEYRRRLELIQDLEFPEAAHRLKASPDGKFMYASGIHPPRLRCYDVSQLTMKFERHLDSEVVDFEILSDDYSKVALLCFDRSLVFQSRAGTHYKARVPRFGRDLAYYPYTADLLVASSSTELFRLNLGEGRFQTPLVSRSPGVNKLGVSPLHGLVAAAGEQGLLECFDARQEKCAGRIDAAIAAGAAGEGLTAVRFDESGLQCAVGTASGLVAIFDLRSSRPMLVKDHLYSSPIVDIKFLPDMSSSGRSGRSIVSADKHIVRVWDATSGKGVTSIQPPAGGINDVLLWKNSGLLMVACDAPKVQAYFVPSLGPAPKWCSFLEGLTEELEESANPTIYDDYRFVTREELKSLGMSHLVGTTLLRAYMHGYFVHNKLWQKAKAIAAPLDYSTVRKERIQSKLEAERAQRITLKRKLPKVNAALAAKLVAEEEEEAAGGKKKKAKASARDLLEDDRFQSMFTDPAFTIDEAAEEYKLLHPNAERKRTKKLVAEHFENLPSEGEEDDSEADSGSEAEDVNSEGDAAQPSEKEQPSELEQLRIDKKHLGKGKTKVRREPRMLAAKSDAAARAFQKKQSLSALQGLPLAERSERAVMNYGKGGFRIGGQREVTFMPRGRGGRGRGRAAGGSPSGERGRGRGRGGRGRSRGRGRGREGR